MMLRGLLAIGLALFGAQGSAQPAVGPYQEGTHYFLITPAQRTATGDQIEVVEAFSFACGACARFEPYVQAWRKKMPADVRLVLMPAQFNETWTMLARAYYAGLALGIDEQAHQAVFDAVHLQRSVRTLEDVAAVYARFGRTAEEFIAVANSFAVNAKLAHAKTTLPRYQITGTPNLIVAGKYRITDKSAGGHDKMFAVVDFLIAQERAASTAAVPGEG
jgi:protein dithiol oxidoreductase (disulfide-forming)